MTVVDRAKNSSSSTPDATLESDFEWSVRLDEGEVSERMEFSALAVRHARSHELLFSASTFEREGAAVREMNVELFVRQKGISQDRQHTTENQFLTHFHKFAYALRNSESLHVLSLSVLSLFSFAAVAISFGQPLGASIFAGTKYLLTLLGVSVGIFACAYLTIQAIYKTRVFAAKILLITAAIILAFEVALLVEFALGRLFAHYG